MKSIGVLALVGLTSISSYGATVLFSDSFNRTGDLNGSSVQTFDSTFYPIPLSWVASNNNQTVTSNGGQTGGWNARVNFTPTVGQKYLLTIVAGPTINNAFEMGFGDAGGFGDYNGLQQDVANMDTARIGAETLYNTYGSTVGGTRVHAAYTLDAGMGPGNMNTLTLEMDTTNGLASAQFVWSVNGVQKGTWTGNVTTYDSVIFGRGRFGAEGGNDPSWNATVSEITLSVVPEQTSALLGGLGVLCLLRRRRATRSR